MGFNENYMKNNNFEPLYIKRVQFKHFVAMFRFFEKSLREKESLTASFYPYGNDSWVESNFQLHYDERVKKEARKYGLNFKKEICFDIGL